MAKFLTTKEIAFRLDEIIKKAKSNLYIISPYLQLSNLFYDRLAETRDKGVCISFVYGKTELAVQEEELIKKLKCNVYYKDNLHAKCYINDDVALITSMNLHTFSETHNREFGVLLTKAEDAEAYNDCLLEIESIIYSSMPRWTEQKDELEVMELKPRNYSDFMSLWKDYLSNKFPATSFEINEDTIYANSLLNEGIDFSTRYGFATFTFKSTNWSRLESIKDSKITKLKKGLEGYRLFWDSCDKICLYKERNLIFKNLEEELEYCADGFNTLVTEIQDINIK